MPTPAPSTATRAQRLRAVLLTARAMELEAGAPDEARGLAMEAHRLAPDLVPASVIAARLLTRHGDIRRASRILETAWKAAPHPDIAAAYADSPARRFGARPAEARAASWPTCAPTIAEGAHGDRPRRHRCARLAGGARGAGRADPAAQPSEGVCLLMAEIEEGEHGDQGRVRAWLARALAAPRDPAWIADGRVFAEWAPVSPVSGRVDAFEWKAPPDRLPAERQMEIEALGDGAGYLADGRGEGADRGAAGGAAARRPTSAGRAAGGGQQAGTEARWAAPEAKPVAAKPGRSRRKPNRRRRSRRTASRAEAGRGEGRRR